MKFLIKSVRTLMLVAGLVVGATSASYAIECNENAQVFRDGRELITPFCQDNYLAIIARSYGLRVSGREIRGNPNVKQDVCEKVGHDTRVIDTCAHLVDIGHEVRR